MTNIKPAAGSALQVFNFTPVKKAVRTMLRDGEPWFVAADVCAALSLSNPSMMVQALDADERAKFNLGRQGAGTVINESGLFILILRCRDAMKQGTVAHKFRKWVTSEVLPALRRTGHFETQGAQPAAVVAAEPPLASSYGPMLSPRQRAIAQTTLDSRLLGAGLERGSLRRGQYQVWRNVREYFKVTSWQHIQAARYKELLDFISTTDLSDLGAFDFAPEVGLKLSRVAIEDLIDATLAARMTVISAKNDLDGAESALDAAIREHLPPEALPAYLQNFHQMQARR